MLSQLRGLRRLGLAIASLSLSGTVAAQAEADQLDSLLAAFRAEEYFWRQFQIGEEMVELGDLSVLSELEPWLEQEDRHVRGVVAFIFAKFGDPRGFSTIMEILDDYSAERLVEWQGGSLISSLDQSPEEAMERYLRSPAALRAQITSDRYYAVHLLGELRDARAVEILVPLLDDKSIDYNVAWALGEIGDGRAIPELIDALNNPDAHVRATAIHALAKMHATEARPYIQALLSDTAVPHAGDQIPVRETARAALESLALEVE